MKTIQEYILKEKAIFVGLEDSKKTWKLCVRYSGMVVHEVSMEAAYVGLNAYLKRHFPECKIQLMYEAGFSGFGLHDQLTQDGVKCIVTPAHTVTQEKNSKVKTDKIDAKRLAKNLENRDFKACFIPPQKQREDRQISRTLDQIQRKIISIKNQIRRALECHGIDYLFKPGAWTTKDYRLLEEKLPTLSLSAPLQFSLTLQLNLLGQLRKHKLDLVKYLRRLAKSDEYKKEVDILKSAPGIGLITAIRLLLELIDVKRFESEKKFSSFLGLTPGEHSSGEMIHKGHITEQGNRLVRSSLIEAAWIAIRKDSALLGKFNAVWSHSGSKKKAIVATARKMAIRLRAILLSGQPYQLGIVA